MNQMFGLNAEKKVSINQGEAGDYQLLSIEVVASCYGAVPLPAESRFKNEESYQNSPPSVIRWWKY